jgi:hypothetical protein
VRRSYRQLIRFQETALLQRPFILFDKKVQISDIICFCLQELENHNKENLIEDIHSLLLCVAHTLLLLQ